MALNRLDSGKMALNGGQVALRYATTMMLKVPLVGKNSCTCGLKVDEIVSLRLGCEIVGFL